MRTPTPGPGGRTDRDAPCTRRRRRREEEPAAVSAGPDGFVLQSEDGDYRLAAPRLRPRSTAASSRATRARSRSTPSCCGACGPSCRARSAKYFDFNIMPDFGGGNAVLQDAYLDVQATRRRLARAGRQVQGARGPGAAAVRDGDPVRGAGLSQRAGARSATWAWALRRAGWRRRPVRAPASSTARLDGGSVDRDLNDGKDLAGRLFLSPFKKGTSALKDLGFGIAGTHRQPDGRATRRTAPADSSAIVSLRPGRHGRRHAHAAGRRSSRSTPGPSACWRSTRGRTRSSGARRPASAPSVERQRLADDGRRASLTGERASFAGVRPTKPFDPGQGAVGRARAGVRA